jgi:maltooligosyltrehalose synthase
MAVIVEERGKESYPCLTTSKYVHLSAEINILCMAIFKADELQNMGFTAIWISPVVEQVADPSRGYTGYAAQDLYSLNSNFGTAADLKALAAALHERNMVGMKSSFLHKKGL